MENIDVGSKQFSNKEIEKYRQEYGVEIRQLGNKINLTGGMEELNIVTSRIRRDIFLSNNQGNYDTNNLKKEGISSNLENVLYKTDYSRIKF